MQFHWAICCLSPRERDPVLLRRSKLASLFRGVDPELVNNPERFSDSNEEIRSIKKILIMMLGTFHHFHYYQPGAR